MTTPRQRGVGVFVCFESKIDDLYFEQNPDVIHGQEGNAIPNDGRQTARESAAGRFTVLDSPKNVAEDRQKGGQQTKQKADFIVVARGRGRRIFGGAAAMRANVCLVVHFSAAMSAIFHSNAPLISSIRIYYSSNFNFCQAFWGI